MILLLLVNAAIFRIKIVGARGMFFNKIFKKIHVPTSIQMYRRPTVLAIFVLFIIPPLILACIRGFLECEKREQCPLHSAIKVMCFFLKNIIRCLNHGCYFRKHDKNITRNWKKMKTLMTTKKVKKKTKYKVIRLPTDINDI